mmetsp:Transcript_20413/g.46022  ORF Transcript_20413/g.46022 Transcript_20413/m.46022 type:complete len:235 (-) Transcript_20413:269-973(-)
MAAGPPTSRILGRSRRVSPDEQAARAHIAEPDVHGTVQKAQLEAGVEGACAQRDAIGVDGLHQMEGRCGGALRFVEASDGRRCQPAIIGTPELPGREGGRAVLVGAPLCLLLRPQHCSGEDLEGIRHSLAQLGRHGHRTSNPARQGEGRSLVVAHGTSHLDVCLCATEDHRHARRGQRRGFCVGSMGDRRQRCRCSARDQGGRLMLEVPVRPELQQKVGGGMEGSTVADVVAEK